MPRIYISTDIEGVSGVTQESQSFADPGRYEAARMSLTRDVNAAVLGARDAGATEIVVLDGHGANAGYNFCYEELVDGARYQLGGPRTTFLEGIDEGFDALFCVGYHAMAGTRGAILDHTQSSRAIVDMWLNGQLIGELAMTAYAAAHYGVPLTLVTGDDRAAAETDALTGGTALAAIVKQGAKRQSALCLAPGEARALIRQRAAEAVRQAASIPPLRCPAPPVELKVQYLRTEMAEGFWARPDVEMLDDRTVVFRRDNVLDVMNAYAGLHFGA